MGFNKLILHIGAEKTGSTSIQKTLEKNTSLLNESRIQLAPANPWVKTASRKTQAFLYSSSYWYQRYLPQADITLISSELFHSRVNSREQLEYFKRLSEKYFKEVTIVCYLREQASLCRSVYSTALKSANYLKDDGTFQKGATPSFEEFIRHCHPGNIYYNYYDYLSLWAEVFGKENMIVRQFDKSTLKDSDVVADFFDVLGAECDIKSETAHANPSLSLLGIELIKALNESLPIKSKRWRRVKRYIAQNYPGAGPAMTQAQADGIYSAFEAENHKLSEVFFSGNLRFSKPVFEEKLEEKSEVLERSAIQSLLDEILQQVP